MEDFPRTIEEFEDRFVTQYACRAYIEAVRWPDGFRCPVCQHDVAAIVRVGLYQCRRCRRQTSATAGTVFQDTRKLLVTWFRAMWYVTSQKNGASALGLQRVLGLGSYETAWTWLHKLRRAMVRPDRDRLSGWIEVDETYIGGLSEGVAGRQKAVLVVIAAQVDGPGNRTDQKQDDSGRLRREPTHFRRGLHRTRQHGAYGWMAGLCWAGEEGL